MLTAPLPLASPCSQQGGAGPPAKIRAIKKVTSAIFTLPSLFASPAKLQQETQTGGPLADSKNTSSSEPLRPSFPRNRLCHNEENPRHSRAGGNPGFKLVVKQHVYNLDSRLRVNDGGFLDYDTVCCAGMMVLYKELDQLLNFYF